ncbi:MAG TPA: cytidylate kinase-like family protein [Ktedonobacterales bacterium]
MSQDKPEDNDTEAQRRPVVTIAGRYGAGGHIIGPRVAERLGVQFLDRAIPDAIARQMGIPESAVESEDEHPQSRMSRMLGALAQAPLPTSGESAGQLRMDDRAMQSQIEDFLAKAAAAGGVILGRGGAVVLASVPSALHVFLQGPRDARVKRVMDREHVDRQTAEHRVDANDRARREYVHQRYGVEGDDPGLYHLVIDGCAFEVDSIVDFIVHASQLRLQQAES